MAALYIVPFTIRYMTYRNANARMIEDSAYKCACCFRPEREPYDAREYR